MLTPASFRALRCTRSSPFLPHCATYLHFTIVTRLGSGCSEGPTWPPILWQLLPQRPLPPKTKNNVLGDFVNYYVYILGGPEKWPLGRSLDPMNSLWGGPGIKLFMIWPPSIAILMVGPLWCFWFLSVNVNLEPVSSSPQNVLVFPFTQRIVTWVNGNGLG